MKDKEHKNCHTLFLEMKRLRCLMKVYSGYTMQKFHNKEFTTTRVVQFTPLHFPTTS
ncbi:unnamed protein product [Tenebrio molitor]|nr:unnamed protein product [Tenebrio molitor]